MSDFRDPAFPTEPASGSDEALSAYLLGELDDAATAAFERRLAADPTLGARLDALAGALTALAGVDQVAEPEGFADRLEARLEAERAVTDLDARRARRQRWSAMLTAAAGVVVMAVAGVQVLGGAGDMGESAGMDESTDMEMAQESALRDSGAAAGSAGAEMYSADYADVDAEAPVLEATAQDGGDEGTSASGGGMPARSDRAPAGSDARSEPVILDEGATMDTDDEARARYMGLPEAEQLRGMARDEVAETAARHADLVRQAGPFASGVRPDACLDEVRGGPEGRVVARVELVRWQGGETLAYLLGTTGPGSAQLDRYELWLVGPEGCDTRRLLTWE